MDLFDKFQEEIKNDTQIDQMNLLDRQMMLPAVKHKWVARLIEQKRTRNSLERKKKILKEEVLKKLESGGIPTGVPKASIKEKVEASDTIKKINEELEDTNLLIDYLEKIEGIFRSMTFDIKNITEISKLETT
jgi:predicted xylose isomerase-like sugar epimerase